MSDEHLLSDHRYIVYRIDTSQETLKTIRNPRNADYNKFKNELVDQLNYYYYNVFRVEGKDDVEVAAAMLDTSIRDSFTSSCPEKIIQDKSMWWTKELNELRKSARRKLRVAVCRMCQGTGNHILRLSVGIGGW